LLEAIDAAAARGAVSVSQVADELGLDRSGASRMISLAVGAGHVERRSAEDDARRAEVAMTRRGRALLGSARAWQQAAFERMLADWPRADVQKLSSYLERLARQSYPEESP
jgi:DNA-binding MarR family transcriptional regulator